MRPMKTLAAAVVAAVPLLGGCYHGYYDDDYECDDGEAYYLDVNAGFADHHDHYQPRHLHYDHRYHGGGHHHHHRDHHHGHHGGGGRHGYGHGY